jgi:cell division protein FtsB
VTLALLFLAIALAIDGVVGEHGWLANRRARQQYEGAVEAVNAVRRTNAALREEADRLRTDPTAIEDVARRDLGLLKPGEKLFIIHDVSRPAK